MRTTLKGILIFSLSSFFLAANASDINKKLTFSEPKELSFFSSIENSFFIPEKTKGKIPAVILMHTCGGLHSSGAKSNMREWAKKFLAANYAVLVVDHLKPRGVGSNCPGKNAAMPIRIGSTIAAGDAYDAATHLAKYPQIDASRIFTLGWSMGAMASAQVASASSKYFMQPGSIRPRAAAGMYGVCGVGYAKYLKEDIDLPILWLMGEDDLEAPVKECLPTIKALEEKGIITHHTYPEATHSWDMSHMDGKSQVVGNGRKVTYRYNANVTEDSFKRTLAFFESFPSEMK